jgi:Flp pilus assembly pilin Flp
MQKINLSALRSKSRGQGMMEYIIIVALIAIAAIGTYSVFGTTVRNQSAGLAKELSGNKADNALSNAATSAGEAETRANATKGLGSYNTDNDSK